MPTEMLEEKLGILVKISDILTDICSLIQSTTMTELGICLFI